MQKTKLVKRGYVDHQERIRNSLEAGHRLELWRQGKYDFPDGMEPSGDQFEVPKTRRKGYEMADASMDLRALSERAEMRKRAKKDTENEAVSTSDTNIKSDVSQDGAVKKPVKKEGVQDGNSGADS
jgi:hypothetical protein